MVLAWTRASASEWSIVSCVILLPRIRYARLSPTPATYSSAALAPQRQHDGRAHVLEIAVERAHGHDLFVGLDDGLS